MSVIPGTTRHSLLDPAPSSFDNWIADQVLNVDRVKGENYK